MVKEEQKLDQGPDKKNDPKAVDDKEVLVKESEYRKLKDDIDSYKDKYLRLVAEFDNARKRMEREKIEFTRYANESLILEFLAILDNLELSVKAANEKHEDYQAFLKGVEIVMANIYEMLKNCGVKPIKAVGKKFDPHSHEVLMQEPSAEIAEGTVLEEFQKGYTLDDKVIRTVKVKVAQKKDGLK